MNIYRYDIVFQEVPNHISLAFYVCGCPLRCPGCHSPELWTEKTGVPLTMSFYRTLLLQYQGKADCILFLGGEWHSRELVEFLKEARTADFKTALYTGLDDVTTEIKSHLTFLKTGPWRAKLGGLSSPTTNQVFRDLTTNTVLNHLFQP
ncbi:anaerobic ribonucleoside-triphosphate reductase activating protein [Bdellovibrio sp. BCCA]|uniref:anaerobic ribonucleoside-triphosphate reductase activating protein n=1 Tax=Bdellovibrio sp. BCCA TaxID=3136281 RepID=UPI0030F19D7E